MVKGVEMMTFENVESLNAVLKDFDRYSFIQYDYDGVLSNKDLYIHNNSYCVTGRGIDEFKEVTITQKIPVYFRPCLLENKGNHTEWGRIQSAIFKAEILQQMKLNDVNVTTIIDDDLLQLETIKNICRNKFKINYFFLKSKEIL